ncbi:sensor histidine kinase [Caulobacter sp. FWC2]|uniref:sensor histidine kinase n=1 Tax=Caulobacter sp. FWC2 TaxID=69664 RepID=UPI001E4E6415|nr:PAS domain S-box protein [Caulobacter sp. FWC2]
MSWIHGDARPASLAAKVVGGALAAGLSVALGALLRAHAGGGEPLMAVFPILLVTCLRLGPVAGWLCLVGGLLGAWYVYLGQPFSFVINGQETRALVTAAIVGGLIIGVCGLRRSALRKHEQVADALILNEAQFRASFENAAVGKVQTEPVSGRIIRVNQAFAAMLGYRPEELVGRIGWELTLEADREADQDAYQLMLDGERPAYIREKRYVRRDGEVIWARASATVTRSPKTGHPILAAAVVENIDEQHRSRLALVNAKQDLEILSAEQAATIAQRDLLLREVYHRVKNNLQIIDSLLVMQRRRLSDPEARAALAGLRGRVFALGLVHHQLMGSQDLKTFDAAPFLEELSSNLLQGVATKDVRLSVNAMPLQVGLDFAIPLGLIVTELVTNSLKHAFPSGEGAIEVLLKRGEDDRVVLIVSDDGTAAASSGSEAAPASLGVTIVDGLVRQLGGTLTVRRGPGFHTEIDLPGPVV